MFTPPSKTHGGHTRLGRGWYSPALRITHKPRKLGEGLAQLIKNSDFKPRVVSYLQNGVRNSSYTWSSTHLEKTPVAGVGALNLLGVDKEGGGQKGPG